jgi:glycosyltransferase involved in cell wall biosynthesis
VIQLCEFDRPEAGAFVPMILDLCRRAIERGWTAEAVFTESARGRSWIADLEAAGVRVRFAPRGSRRALARWLRAILNESPAPTVMHSHFTTFDVPAVLARGSRPLTAVVWHVHSTLMTEPISIARNAAKFATFGRQVDALLCPAQNIADGVIRRLGSVDRVHFFPSALDVGAYPLQGPAERRLAREKLGLPDDAVVLLHFGWHWYLKGGDVFLEVVERLRDDGLERLIGLERGGADVGAEEVSKRGLDGVVRVVPPVEDIRELFAAADVLVSSSRSEGMAYSVLESICSGTPVVATQIPGHIYIGARTPACTVVRREPALLAGAVRDFLDRDPGRAAAEAVESRDWVAANLGLEVVSTRLLDNYASLLAGHVPTRWS